MITVRTLAVGLAAVLLATLAWAQEANGDDVLERYRLATSSLQQANAALAEDAVAARTELDRAYSALLTLSRGGSAPLASSLDRVFERARTAIENRSATDLAVQTSVLRGGFQRMLYESALVSAVEGRDAQAESRLSALAGDVGLGSARLDQLQAAVDVAEMRRVFEAGVAERVEARLTSLLDAAPPADTDAAYRTLSAAYADFLLVQDSGRLDPATQGRIVGAAEALVAGEFEAYGNDLAAAAERLVALRDAADAGQPEDVVAQVPPAAEPVDGPEPDPEPDPTAEPPAEVQEMPDAADPDAAPQPAAEPDDGATEEVAGVALPSDDDPEATAELALALEEGAVTLPMLRAAFAAEAEEARVATEVEALGAELTAAGLPAAVADGLAEDLHASGIRSVTELERDLAARVARIEAEIQRARPAAARAELARLAEAYDVGLGRIVPRVAPDADLAYQDLLTRTSASPALRPQEASLLAAATTGLSDALRSPGPHLATDLADTAHTLWSGWVRAAIAIALGLLALIPLRLLRIAFGGGNRNWRLVGAALFLLLLPVFVEALISAGALLAEPLSMPLLAAGTVFSIFANETAQMAWFAATALAILLASFGFYGICVQFGVIGRGPKAAAAKEPAKQATRDETLVDWDDDY